MAKSFTFSVDTRLIATAAVALLIGLGVGWWQPWVDDVQRTIDVSGSATLDAQPDEYIFNPTIEVTTATQQAAKEQAAELGDKLAQSLIELGVAKDKITSDSSNYRAYFTENDQYTGYYSLEVAVDNEELSQKVYDVLIANESVTRGADPQVTFSEKRSKQLESDARTKAVKDAKAQAEVTAKELGLRVGKVVSVKDGQQSGGVQPYYRLEQSLSSTDSAQSDTNFYQGTDEYSFSVKATFELH